MELQLKDELYARAIGWEVMRLLKSDEESLKSIWKETDSDALRVLEKIQCILNDDTLDDPDCFDRIERIVRTFNAHNISTSRHDWG